MDDDTIYARLECDLCGDEIEEGDQYIVRIAHQGSKSMLCRLCIEEISAFHSGKDAGLGLGVFGEPPDPCPVGWGVK
jgi:hypothetical protein